MDSDPYELFASWHAVAEDEVMYVATASADAVPNVRAVLLGGLDERGFRFFTSYESAKGSELADNPRAALAWYWPPERQVRAQGAVERLRAEESDAYWESRPRDHQLAIHATPQGAAVASAELLEQRLAGAKTCFSGRALPRPATWGGYRVVPALLEFWTQRPNRLHERIRYRRTAGGWDCERLAP